MELRKSLELKSILTPHAWDLAICNYGYAGIKEDYPEIYNVAAELEYDAAWFVGAKTFKVSPSYYGKGDEMQFYNDEKLVHEVKNRNVVSILAKFSIEKGFTEIK